jgi:hypothetical protein
MNLTRNGAAAERTLQIAQDASQLTCKFAQGSKYLQNTKEKFRSGFYKRK